MGKSDNVLVEDVTRQLRELRKTVGVTGDQLAERLGIAVQNLRRIEAGQNMTLRTLAKVAAALGFKVVVAFEPNVDAPKQTRSSRRQTKP